MTIGLLLSPTYVTYILTIIALTEAEQLSFFGGGEKKVLMQVANCQGAKRVFSLSPIILDAFEIMF